MAALHPQVVHFTIVPTIIGVAFRLVSLVGKPAFASPAATTPPARGGFVRRVGALGDCRARTGRTSAGRAASGDGA
jgi:uncharacterized membrane protein